MDLGAIVAMASISGMILGYLRAVAHSLSRRPARRRQVKQYDGWY